MHHFASEYQSYLKVVFYKHTGNEIDITNILSCENIHPFFLKKFLECWIYVLKNEFVKLEYERFYLFEIKWNSNNFDDLKIINVEDVSEKSGTFTLH